MRTKRVVKKDKGQFLIELLVALTLAVMIIVAVVGLSSVSVKTAYRAKQDTEAKRLAEEAMEWLRSEKKSNWYSFYNNRADDIDVDVDYCLNSLSWSSSSPCIQNITGKIYKREVKLYRYPEPGKQKVRATVVVSWIDNQGSHNVTLTTIFTSEE